MAHMNRTSHENWNRVNEISGNYPISVLYPDDTVSTYRGKSTVSVLKTLETINNWDYNLIDNVQAAVTRNEEYWEDISRLVAQETFPHRAMHNNVLDAAIADIMACNGHVSLYTVSMWLDAWMQGNDRTGLQCTDESYIMAYLAQEGFVNELEVEMYCSTLIACGIVSAMHRTFDDSETGLAIEIAENGGTVERRYRCRHCGYVDADRHMFNGAMNCIYCQQDRLAPTIVPDSEWDSYNPGKLASEPDIFGYDD